jgi:hypothetical protein
VLHITKYLLFIIEKRPCSKSVLWRENEVAQDDGQAGLSMGTKTLSQVQGSVLRGHVYNVLSGFSLHGVRRFELSQLLDISGPFLVDVIS